MMRIRRLGLVVLVTIGLAPATVSLASSADVRSGPDPARTVVSELPVYGQVIVHPLLLKYTPEFLANERRRRHRIEGRDLERIRRDYHDIVTAKLASVIPFASKPGPDVVRVDAVLVDHELDKRDWLAPTRIVFRTAPAVQLVAYLRDSQTGEIFDVVGMTLRPNGDRLMKESPGFYWHFMRQVFDRIATRVRWAIEKGASGS